MDILHVTNLVFGSFHLVAKLGALRNLEGPTFSNLPFKFYRNLRIKVYSNVKRDFSRSRSCERDSLKITCSPITVLSSCDGKTRRLPNARVRSLSAIERLFYACFDLFLCILLITLRAQARARKRNPRTFGAQRIAISACHGVSGSLATADALLLWRATAPTTVQRRSNTLAEARTAPGTAQAAQALLWPRATVAATALGCAKRCTLLGRGALRQRATALGCAVHCTPPPSRDVAGASRL